MHFIRYLVIKNEQYACNLVLFSFTLLNYIILDTKKQNWFWKLAKKLDKEMRQ